MIKKNLGTNWHAVNPRSGSLFKKPFASTTQSDSELVRDWAERGYTWNGMAKVSPYLSDELQVVIQRFIDDGFGNTPMSDHVG